MVSLLFAGTALSSFDTKKRDVRVADPGGPQALKSGRVLIGTVAGFIPERWPASNRNTPPAWIGIRTLVAGTSDIQELSKTYEMVARAKTELWHRILTHYLPLYFPEADRFHRSSRGDWFLAFLKAYPSPRMITAMDKDAFIAAAWPVVGRRVGKAALLADIYEASKTSVGLPVPPDSDALRMFRLVLAQGRSLIQQRNAIEKRAAQLLGDHPDYRLLRTIPGIGPVNALAVLAEAGD